MLGRGGTAYAKKASKFQDSDSTHTPRPRAMSDLQHWPAPRVLPRPRTTAAAVGSPASGARHRAIVAPRSPLHEKKTAAGSACGAGSRVPELEAKLGKAHVQLTEMRGQLATAEKARKDARGAFDDAKKRFATKHRDVATSAPVKDDHDGSVPPEQSQQAEAVTDGGSEEGRSMIIDSETKEAKKKTDDGYEVNNIAVINELMAKLAAKDREVYEVRANLMAKDVEINELNMNITARDTAIDELTAKLVAKNTEIVAFRADNADLVKTASEAAVTVRETTAAKAREVERAMRETVAREARLAEQLAASEREREALEAEARRSRVQSEQWRKAAEEAAAVLGGLPGSRDMQRHGSVGSNDGKIDMHDVGIEGSGGKRKSGGAVQLFADLWKKKSPK